MRELQDLLITQYNLGDRHPAITGHIAGRHDIYRIKTNSGELIAKVGRGFSGVAAVKREALAFKCLAATTAVIPRLLLSSAGEACILTPDGCAILVCEAIQGRPAAETEQGFARYGDALARFHVAIGRIPAHDRATFAEFDPIAVVTRAVGALCQGPQGATCSSRLALIQHFVIGRLEDTQELWGQDALGHGDAHFFNLLFRDGGDGCWIDLEDMYRGPIVYDLATLVWSTFRQRRTQPLWEAGLNEYARVANVTSDQLNCLGVFVAIRQLWWLSLHSAAWGQFPMHTDSIQFFKEGLTLLDIICRDACGM